MRPPLQYFFPRWGNGTPPEPFRDMFAASCNRTGANAHGPNKLRGMMFSRYPNTLPGYDEANQRWQPFAYHDNEGREQSYYIGVAKDADASEFQRPATLGGSIVELEHGDWIIPVANPLLDENDLPYHEMPDGLGGWHKEYKEAYVEASDVAIELCGQLREVFVQQSETGEVALDMSDDDFRKNIATMIGVNYDLTLVEMGALRLFDRAKYLSLMFAFLDAEEMMRMIVQEQEEANGTLNPTEGPADGKSIASGGTE